MQIDFFQHFQTRTCFGIPVAKLAEFLAIDAARSLTFRVQEMRVSRTFVVHSQNRSRCGFGGITAVGIDVENVHAVVVITHTLIPIVSFQTLIGILRHIAGQSITCGMQNFNAVARRHMHLIQDTFGNRIEAQKIRARQLCNGRI